MRFQIIIFILCTFKGVLNTGKSMCPTIKVTTKLPILCIVCYTTIKYKTFLLIDEETGCNVGDFKVAITRRWNYENTVAAIVCYVATGI